jgi:hypothetical protein
MRTNVYLFAALLIAAWLVAFFINGTTGVIQIPSLKINFRSFTGALRRTVQIVGFSSLMLILQNCATHYVADVPVGPVEVQPVAPFYGAVWIGGDWVWRGGHHVWVGGHWDHPRAGRSWQAGEWRSGPRGHYWARGRWK